VLGQQIRKARQSAGLTQEEVGFRSRLSRNYISLVELDEKSPTFAALHRICKAIGIRTSLLVARAERSLNRKK
jgi:transcriptional regulator with XRE-family HTH domain